MPVWVESLWLTRPSHRNWLGLALAASAFGLLVGIGGNWFIYRVGGHSSPKGVSSNVGSDRLPVGLAIRMVEAGLLVTWDTSSPQVRAADRGTLIIKDGDWRKQMELNRGELASRSVFYKPENSDVDVKLELSISGVTRSSEYITFISSAESGQPVAAIPTLKVFKANTLVSTPVEGTAARSELAPLGFQSSTKATFKPPDSKGNADITARVLTLSIPDDSVNPIRQAPSNLNAILPQALVNSTLSPPKSEAGELRESGHGVTPPIPVRRIVPTLTSNLREFFRHGAEVEVVVSIDANGIPTGAKPVHGPAILYESAVRTAMQWRFQPAHSANKNLPSEMSITFRFKHD